MTAHRGGPNTTVYHFTTTRFVRINLDQNCIISNSERSAGVLCWLFYSNTVKGQHRRHENNQLFLFDDLCPDENAIRFRFEDSPYCSQVEVGLHLPGCPLVILFVWVCLAVRAGEGDRLIWL